MNINIKKAYVELVEFLEANENKKVSTILDEVKLMCQSRTMSKTYSTDEEGNVVAIHDWYFKKWVPVSHVEFGAKANTATGLSTMCKEATRLWTKQQRDAQKATEELIPMLKSGEISIEELPELEAEIQRKRVEILPSEQSEYMFDTEEECLAFIAEQS